MYSETLLYEVLGFLGLFLVAAALTWWLKFERKKEKK